MAAKRFDPKSLGDRALQNSYLYQKTRVNEIYSSFAKGYLGHEKAYLEFEYFIGKSFYASTNHKRGKDYIDVSSPTIFLLRCLFDYFLADEGFLPEIATSDEKAEVRGAGKVLNAVFSADNVIQGVEAEISDNPNRLLFSSSMTDLCMTFVLCHELAHIVSGHTKYTRLFFNAGCNNFFAFLSKSKRVQIEQAMEYDADVIASVLICQYIEQLRDATLQNDSYNKAFSNYIQKGKLLEDITILCILFLYALFVYLSGYLIENDSENDSHPQPLIRATYIKDVILKQMSARNGDLDIPYVLREMPKVWDQFDEKLSAFGLYQKTPALDKITLNLDEKGLMLGKLAAETRSRWQKYSWLPTNVWS